MVTRATGGNEIRGSSHAVTPDAVPSHHDALSSGGRHGPPLRSTRLPIDAGAPAPTGPIGLGAVAAHLERMHTQRVALFDALADVAEHRLWERPTQKKWSPGEHLDHTRVLNACFRRLLSAAWPVVSPWPALQPSALRRLERALATEHDAIARFYASKPERALGHVTVWDPAIGRLNLVQVLRVGVHHDQHHYRAVRRMFGRPDPDARPGT